MPTSPTLDGIIPPASKKKSFRERTLWRWIKNRLWYVHPGLDMVVAMTPIACLYLLDKTSKPDVKRLELRNLFNGGRRYHLYTTQTGFVVLTTSKLPWRYRGRTTPSAVVEGVITPQEGRILIHLMGRIRLTYVLSSLLLPFFMASIVIFVPWPALIKAVIIFALFGLSWAGHRFNAALESYETMHYIQQVLRPYIPEESLTLPTGQDVVYDAAHFAQVWESFYSNLQQDL
jgi:hypothetical protein